MRLFLLFLMVILVGCAQPRSHSVVSATPNSKAYVYRDQARMAQEYISALEDAKEEGGLNAPAGAKVPSLDEYALTSDEEMEQAFQEVLLQTDAGVVGKADDGDFGALWGRPPAFLGEGATILNKQIRGRFNDAIATTPTEGKVEWRYGKHQFIFMPNSAIFQPFYSGGNCRDGVFIHFDGVKNDRTRALFCQKGPGADWYVQR